MSKVFVQKQKKEINVLKQTLEALQQFLKIIHNQGSYKSSKLVDKLPFPYSTYAHNVVRMLVDFENTRKTCHSLESELNQLKAKFYSTESQLMNLRRANNSKIFKNTKSSKTNSQLSDVVQLLKRKKYEKAVQLAPKDIKSIALDVWEYNILKSESNKFRHFKIQNIQPIKTNVSPPYHHLISLLKKETDEQFKIQKQFGKVLVNIIKSFQDEYKNQTYQFLNAQNKHLIESIDVYCTSLKKQYGRLKQQNIEFYNILEIQCQKQQQEPQKQEDQQNQFHQLQQEHFFDKQKSKGINVVSQKKQSKAGKKGKKYVKMQNQNSSKPKSKTQKIIQVSNAVKNKKFYNIKQLTNTHHLEDQQYTIDDLKVMNDSLKDRNNQLEREEKKISQKLQSINMSLINLINMQNGKEFEKNSINVQKCYTIGQNIELIQIQIHQLQNKIDELQKIDDKCGQDQDQQQLLKQFCLKANLNIQEDSNVCRIYPDNQLSPLDQEIIIDNSSLDLLKCENEKLKEKCQRLENEIDNQKRDNDNWNTWIAELIQQTNQFATQIQTKNKLIQQLREEIEQLKENANRLVVKAKKHINKIDDLQSQIKLCKSVYQPQGTFKFNQSIYPGLHSVYQQKYNLVDKSIFAKDQEIEKQIQRLQAELQSKMKETQNLEKQIIQNEVKFNKLKNEKELIDKRILTIEKKEAYNDQLQKQLFEESTNYHNQINTYLARIQKLQIQLQQQKILNASQRKQKDKMQQTFRRKRTKSTISVDNGINTQFVEPHNKEKEIIQNTEKHLKMQEQHLKTIADQQQKIKDLQHQKQKQRIIILKLKKEKKQAQNNKDKQIKQLTQSNEQKEKTIIQKTQQIEQLRQDIQKKEQKHKQFQLKMKKSAPIVQQNSIEQKRFTDHLFTAGQIFDDSIKQRLFLINQLQQKREEIKRTRLIYKYDDKNKVNIHKYVDYKKQIVVIIHIEFGKMIAAYSQQAFNPNGIVRGDGLLLSLWNQKTYNLGKGKKAITYDDFYLIFGNSQIRLKSLQLLVFSNFGINNAFYQTQGCKIEQLLGEDDREIAIDSYEVYSLQFAN